MHLMMIMDWIIGFNCCYNFPLSHSQGYEMGIKKGSQMVSSQLSRLLTYSTQHILQTYYQVHFTITHIPELKSMFELKWSESPFIPFQFFICFNYSSTITGIKRPMLKVNLEWSRPANVTISFLFVYE